MIIRPVVIAHRGASGYLPEHTREAKALAYGQGADFLEQDVVATRDGALLVLHDIYLERVTDVATQFPDRRREDGHYYAIDFALDEVRRLCVHERVDEHGAAVFPGRFPPDRGGFRVSTLGEELELVAGLNSASGRRVGVYPEIKEPRWHARHGIDLTRLLLEELATRGYRSADDAVYVQCFDVAELERLRSEFSTELRLVQLLDGRPEHEAWLEGEGLAEVARHANALGVPWSRLVEAYDPARAVLKQSRLLERAEEAGLDLHVYTFRRERLPDFVADLEQLLALYLRDIPVAGWFCDFPDVAVKVRDGRSQ